MQCITPLELQTSEVQHFVKEYDEKVSTVMKDDQNVLAEGLDDDVLKYLQEQKIYNKHD